MIKVNLLAERKPVKAKQTSSLKLEGIPEAASTLTRLATGKNKAPAKGE